MTRRKHSPVKWKLKKGDAVVVVAGRARGATGTIESVDRKKAGIVIAGVNLVKKHTKPTQNTPGGIVDKPMPVHISNVALVDPQKGGPTRIGFRIEEGRKIRYAKNLVLFFSLP